MRMESSGVVRHEIEEVGREKKIVKIVVWLSGGPDAST
jgi:hypothetical protein